MAKIKLLEQRGSCPVCGTVMTIRTTKEAITIHRCPGCKHSLALTDQLLIAVPSEAAERLISDCGGEPCGVITKKDFSKRFIGNKPIDQDYVDMVKDFLDSDAVSPEELVQFLDNVDDLPVLPDFRKNKLL